MLAMVAFCGLVVGVVVALVAGAAMGRRTRRDAKLQQNEAPANVEAKPTSDQTKPGDLVPADKGGQIVPPSKRNLGVVLGSALSCELQPLEKPQVDPDFTTMPAIERAVEVLRYNAALCEYRLGSNGWLRAWIFSTLRVLFFLLVPLLAFSVLLAFLVPVMAGVAQIFASIAETSRSLFWASVDLLLTAAAIGFAVVQFRVWRQRMRAGQDRE